MNAMIGVHIYRDAEMTSATLFSLECEIIIFFVLLAREWFDHG